ncbi:DoxX family protein [Streptomyces sp. J2-1]|uniref:DoxX family protein n=1 Tax=Streptomyces corallincola TaxID=2851888 RepID=UPI001C389F16|nr:DoxX family protein [Streptomyces corallincola]MBV2353708.1 DoxX family protein [Streptomyces corallincola]
MTCLDRRDVGLLLLRLGTGGVLAAHGAQKMFGTFGGAGLASTSQFMESVGFVPGRTNALLAGASELGGGLLLAMGLGTPGAGAAAAGAMTGAAAVHTPNGFFARNGGYEHAASLGLTAAGLAITGPGRLSLDHALGHVLNRGWMVPVALGVTAAATSVVVGMRNRHLRRQASVEQEALFDE